MAKKKTIEELIKEAKILQEKILVEKNYIKLCGSAGRVVERIIQEATDRVLSEDHREHYTYKANDIIANAPRISAYMTTIDGIRSTESRAWERIHAINDRIESIKNTLKKRGVLSFLVDKK